MFGLGSILCEILTGQPAFVGETASEVYRKAEKGDLGIHSSTQSLRGRCRARGPGPGVLGGRAETSARDASVVVLGLTAYLPAWKGDCEMPSWRRSGPRRM